MKGIVDRFEGNIAVIECEGRLINIDRTLLPANIKEGSVVQMNDQKKWTLLEEETEERLQRIKGKLNNLFE